jgi:hypothetical protein
MERGKYVQSIWEHAEAHDKTYQLLFGLRLRLALAL